MAGSLTLKYRLRLHKPKVPNTGIGNGFYKSMLWHNECHGDLFHLVEYCAMPIALIVYAILVLTMVSLPLVQ